MEDKATLRSDLSAIPGLREAVHAVLPFSIARSEAASWKRRAINLGVRGRAPEIKAFCRQEVDSSL